MIIITTTTATTRVNQLCSYTYNVMRASRYCHLYYLYVKPDLNAVVAVIFHLTNSPSPSCKGVYYVRWIWRALYVLLYYYTRVTNVVDSDDIASILYTATCTKRETSHCRRHRYTQVITLIIIYYNGVAYYDYVPYAIRSRHVNNTYSRSYFFCRPKHKKNRLLMHKAHIIYSVLCM